MSHHNSQQNIELDGLFQPSPPLNLVVPPASGASALIGHLQDEDALVLQVVSMSARLEEVERKFEASERQRQEAERQRQEAERQRQGAERQRQEAELERQRLEQQKQREETQGRRASSKAPKYLIGGIGLSDSEKRTHRELQVRLFLKLTMNNSENVKY